MPARPCQVGIGPRWRGEMPRANKQTSVGLCVRAVDCLFLNPTAGNGGEKNRRLNWEGLGGWRREWGRLGAGALVTGGRCAGSIDYPRARAEGQRARAIPRTSLERDKMESLISAQPFFLTKLFDKTPKQHDDKINRPLPNRRICMRRGGKSDENGACNLRSPKRDNFGGLQGCAPMVVCLGGFLVWECGSVAFWWLVPNLSCAAVPAQAPTQPRAQKPPGSNHI